MNIVKVMSFFKGSASILFFLCLPSIVWASDFFLGQHVFYLSSYPPIQTKQFDGVRVWSGTSQSVTWRDIEPSPGVFDFNLFDQHVEQALVRQMDVLYTLGQTPQWAAVRPLEKGAVGLGAASEPAYLEDWSNYVHTVAQRYKGRISAYELMNEPRIPEAIRPYSPGFFSGTTDTLIQMTRLAREAIHAADPAAKLVCPAMDGGELGVKRLDYFLAKGGGQYCDVIAFHFYLKTNTVAEFNKLLSDVKVVRARYKLEALPIWNTEIGVLVKQSGRDVKPREVEGPLSRVFDDRDAATLMLKLMLASTIGGIDRTYWFAHDSSSMGSTMPKKTVGQLNGLGVALDQVKIWLKDRTVINCSVADTSSDCVLMNRGNPVGRITWGNVLKLESLEKEKVQVVSLLNGFKYPVASLDDGLLESLTNKFLEPVLLEY